MKIATTPVELMMAPSPPTASISRTSSLVSLSPASEVNRSPSFCATPVRTRPCPMTNKVAISTTLGSAKPASASPMLERVAGFLGGRLQKVEQTVRGSASIDRATGLVLESTVTTRASGEIGAQSGRGQVLAVHAEEVRTLRQIPVPDDLTWD